MKNKESLKKEIAERLKLARELSGLSQLNAAKMLNLSRPAISEIEAGRRNVSGSEIVQFADLYDVESTWILGETDEEQDHVKSKINLAIFEILLSELDIARQVIDSCTAIAIFGIALTTGISFPINFRICAILSPVTFEMRTCFSGCKSGLISVSTPSL